MDLSGKVAIITGGGGKLAQEIGEQFLKEGIKVFLCDLIEDAAASNAELLITKFSSSDVGYGKCDVTCDKSFRDAFRQCKNYFGSDATILINNAGFFDERNWEKTFDVNVKGTVRGTQLALEYMGKDRGRNGGIVMNVASSSGFIVTFPFPYYGSSKASIIHYTRCIGHPFHVPKTGVIIQGICPGFLSHVMKINGKLEERYYNEETKKAVEENRALAKPTSPAHVVQEMIHCMKNPQPGSIKLCSTNNPSRYMEPQADETA